MTDPLAQLQRLYDDKKTVYINGGMSSSVKGRVFINIFGNPSSVLLARGYGKTFDEALRDALSRINEPTPLPGLTTRPTLPGMTR